MTVRIEVGDCVAVMREGLADNSVDAVITDPPYGLTTNKKGGSGVASVNLKSPAGRARVGTGNGAGGFMGHKWDSDVPSVETWAECLRVLKPGGYLLAFASTRTQHRMASRIEDAGFEIRDMIAWVYGQGFPKSRNGEWGGTALKPAMEPITVARKPLVGTAEQNWRRYGTGALNIDECRVGVEMHGGAQAEPTYVGRWPANLIHDGGDEVLAAFPAAGSAARFFYCAKASKADREEGNAHPTVKPTDLMRYLCRLVTPRGGIVLDPFTGSGSTGKAAVLEGFDFIGIEREVQYVEIARRRIPGAAVDDSWLE